MLTTRTEVGTVLVRADRFTHVAYGDRIRATGKIELPKPFETDTGRTFNYPMYLRAHGVTHTMSFAKVEVVAHGEGNWVIEQLLALKHWFIEGIEKALPEPESALLAGLLIGEKRGLGEDLAESFRRAGVIHIIVLSGYNVALVINTVREGFQRVLPRNIALGSAGVIALLFMLMTGASETAVRATLMALVVLLAKVLYRPADGLRILLVVAAGMALWNPYLVLFDLSYQLSVLATLGLVTLSHHLIPYLTWLRSKSLIEIVSTTLATQATVLPLLIISIGQVSIVSLVSNILILLVVPYAMLSGFFAALVALLSPALAFPLSTLAYTLLTYIIRVSEFLGSLPFSAVNL
jgi:competence protein ComEC